MPETNEERIQWLEERVELLLKNQQLQVKNEIDVLKNLIRFDKEMGFSRQIEVSISEVLLTMPGFVDETVKSKIKGILHVMKTEEEFRQDRISKAEAILSDLRKSSAPSLPPG